MFHDSLQERILQRGAEQGVLLRQALPRVRSLVNHGLSLEQALVGTRLLSPETYGDLLAQIVGVPFVRPNPLQLTVDIPRSVRWHVLEAWPVSRHASSLVVAFTHPEPIRLNAMRVWLKSQQYDLEPRVMLRSDWLRYTPPTSRTASVRFLAHRVAQDAQQTVHLQTTVDGGLVWIDAEQATHPSWTASRGRSSGLAFALERRLRRNGWKTTITRTPFGHDLFAERTTNEQEFHPTVWPSAIQTFLKQPIGLIELIRPDHALRIAVEHACRSPLLSVDDPMTYEQAAHRALAGESVAVQTMHASNDWPMLRAAGIPIHVIEGMAHPEGRSWSLIASGV